MATGWSFTGFTVSVNDVEVVFPPSLTMSVIVAEPKALASGVTLTVRLAPLPPSTKLLSFSRAGLLCIQPTTSDSGGVSGSLTVKPSRPVLPSSGMFWLAIALICGGSLTVYS